MFKFDSYSFSRLCVNQDFEFFFILGVNDPDNFSEFWDGTRSIVLGYLVIHTKHEQKKQENFIYLVNNDDNDFENIIRYTKNFAKQMPLSPKTFDYDNEDFKITMTDINPKTIVSPYLDFIKKIVGKDIPQIVLNKMDI